LGARRFMKLCLFSAMLFPLAACSSMKARHLNMLQLASFPVQELTTASTEILPASHLIVEQSGVLALPHAIRLALQQHPDILRAKAYVTKSQTGIKLAGAAWYPELTYGLSPAYSKAGYGSATVGVSQLVYDFGKSAAEVNSAKAQLAKSRYDVNQAKETVTTQLAQDYTNFAASVDQIDQAKFFLLELKKLTARVSSRVEAGASDAGDRATALVALDRARSEVLKAEAQFAVAQSNLAQVLGMVPVKVSSMKTVAISLQHIADQNGALNVPSVLALQSAVEAAKANIARAHAEALPPLKVAGQYTEQATNGGFSGSSWVGLQVSGAFSTSGAAGQRVASAESDLEAAQQLLQSEKLRLRTQVAATSIEADAAIRRAENYKRIHDLAEHSSSLSWQEYQLDKKPLNEVITAEHEKYAAMSDLIAARADVVKAMIKGLANKGQLADGLLAMDQE
jgi:outer membrane protein, adhesin transport system